MEQRDYDQVVARGAGDDGQCGIHRGGSSGCYRGKSSEPAHQQRGGQQGGELATDVGEEGDGTQFGPAILSDENA